MKSRIYSKAILLVICFAVVFALLVLGVGLVEKFVSKSDSSNKDSFSYSDKATGEISYNGKLYKPKKSLETLLVLGTDVMGGMDETATQSDFIAIVVIDESDESFNVLHLNRDTMTQIRQLDNVGKEIGTVKAQLALAYAYGHDGKTACRNSVNAVENLLYGIDITHYLSLTMDAVAAINDSVGGVTVTLLDDFTVVNETWTKNAVVTLNGDEALTYIRARSELEDSTNLSRMERQRQYIDALLDKYRSSDTDTTLNTMLKINEHMVSDCTVEQLTQLIDKHRSYEYKGIRSIAGTAEKGKEFTEYYIDEDAAKQAVVELFYEESENLES